MFHDSFRTIRHSGLLKPTWGAITKCYVFSINLTGDQYFIINQGCSMLKKIWGHNIHLGGGGPFRSLLVFIIIKFE